MRILIINPSVDRSWETRILQAVSGQVNPGVEVEVAMVDSGPDTIETAYDHLLATTAVAELVGSRREEIDDRFDAAIINCFSGPGLYPARELLTIPVVAPGESAFMVAASLGTAIGLITAGGNYPPGTAHPVAVSSGTQALYVGAKDCGLRATELITVEPRKVEQALTGAGRTLITAHGANVLVLGGAMTGLAGKLSGELEVPVVDCLHAALAWAQAFATLGIRRPPRDERGEGRPGA